VGERGHNRRCAGTRNAIRHRHQTQISNLLSNPRIGQVFNLKKKLHFFAGKPEAFINPDRWKAAGDDAKDRIPKILQRRFNVDRQGLYPRMKSRYCRTAARSIMLPPSMRSKADCPLNGGALLARRIQASACAPSGNSKCNAL